jgi:hypothetical protein
MESLFKEPKNTNVYNKGKFPVPAALHDTISQFPEAWQLIVSALASKFVLQEIDAVSWYTVPV